MVAWQEPLWRIHRIAGPHPSAWNELRAYGPISAFRWEPHPPPTGLHTAAGSPFVDLTPAVSYTAGDPSTAFAEVFQGSRIISLTSDRALTAWVPTARLELLDLIDSDFAIRNGAADALSAAPRSTCRAWARAIWAEFGNQVSGLKVRSTMTGDSIVVLFPKAAHTFPVAPAFTRSLDHPDVAALARRAGTRFGWPTVL